MICKVGWREGRGLPVGCRILRTAAVQPPDLGVPSKKKGCKTERVKVGIRQDAFHTE